MSSLNRAMIIGRLGNDPDMRYLPSGEAVANLSIATSETWKDKDGNKKESTEWHRVSFFGKIAEVCGQYLKKGGLVYVEGKIQTRKWQDKEGQDRYTTEIRGERMQMLSGRAEGAGNNSEPKEPPKSGNSGGGQGGFNDFKDDIPF